MFEGPDDFFATDDDGNRYRIYVAVEREQRPDRDSPSGYITFENHCVLHLEDGTRVIKKGKGIYEPRGWEGILLKSDDPRAR